MRFIQGKSSILLTIAGAFLLFTSCSGSGEGFSGSAGGGIRLSPLVVANHVSVVDAQGSGGSSAKPAAKPATTGTKALLIGLVNMSANPLPSTSDYVLDVPSVYVNERSTEAFQDINNILCAFNQTRYDIMINQGPYLALIDGNLCSNNAVNSTSESSGSVTPHYLLWTVRSSRTSETSPHIVDIWFTDTEKNESIVAKVAITKGADTAPPYGVFQVNYQSFDPVLHTELKRGLLISEIDTTTGQALLQYANENPDFTEIKKATLNKNADGTGGGTVLSLISDPMPTAERFDIAYNLTDFLRHNYDGTPDICLDRTHFDESAWSYGLYDQSGSRVNVNGGFSIMKDGNYGWVGYWGLWLNNVTLATGDTVYKHDFQTNVDVPYTVFRSGGKLKKHTRKSLLLADIKNVPLFWNDCSTGSCINYEVVAAETSPGSGTYVFNIVAQQNPAPDYTWNALPTPYTSLNLSALYSTDLGFWSQALSGQVTIKLAGCTFSATNYKYSCPNQDGATTPVIFYAEDIVYPGDTTMPAQLVCFDNCPNATSASGIDATTPLLYSQTSLTYDFDSTALMLRPHGTAYDAVQTVPISGFDYGIMSGALIDPAILTQVDPATGKNYLVCSWDTTNTQICSWQAWSELPVFYTWETGLTDNNKFTGLINGSGGFVRFDPPIQVRYVHHEAGSKYDNVTFYLEYDGFGNLSGIPGVCVDIDTGQIKTTCDNTTRWVPEFTIPDVQPSNAPDPGYLTEVTGPNSVQYIVKALQKEQRMRALTLTDCSTGGLPATTPYPLPSMTLWKAPTNGPQPIVTDTPRVIGGVLQ